MKSLLALSRAIDALNERLGRLANWRRPDRLRHQRRQRDDRATRSTCRRNAWLEIQWYLFAGDGDARRLLHAAHERARARRHPLHAPVRARQGVARPARHAVLPAAVDAADRLAVVAVLHAVLDDPGDLEQRRRADPLAGEDPACRSASCWSRCRASPRSSSAPRRCAATSATRRTTKGRCNDPARVDAAADVRRADRHHADRLSGRVLALRARPRLRLPRRSSSASSTSDVPAGDSRRASSAASSPTSCCSRSRSSRSWARSSRNAGSPRTCSTRWASCSARCAAASATR